MTHATTINRRRALALVAAAPAAGALGVSDLAGAAELGADVKLRQLWAEYVAQYEANKKARDIHRRLRERSSYDAEFDSLELEHPRDHGKLHRLLWKKHGLEPSCAAAHREDTKLRRIVKAIRKVKAESLFGVGVKLSAWEDWDDVSDDEFAEVVDAVRRDIAALIGVDFIAATDELESAMGDEVTA